MKIEIENVIHKAPMLCKGETEGFIINDQGKIDPNGKYLRCPACGYVLKEYVEDFIKECLASQNTNFLILPNN